MEWFFTAVLIAASGLITVFVGYVAYRQFTDGS